MDNAPRGPEEQNEQPQLIIEQVAEETTKETEKLKSECEKAFLTELNEGWELGIDIEETDDDISQLQEKINKALKNLTPNQILAKTKKEEYKLLQDTFLKVDDIFNNVEINNDFKGKLEVDFRENSGASRYIGAGHLLPAHIRCIKITDRDGNTKVGIREPNTYRGIGYIDPHTNKYLPIFTGYTIEIVSVSEFEDLQKQEKEESNADTLNNYTYSLEDFSEDKKTEILNLENQSLTNYMQNLNRMLYNDTLNRFVNNTWDQSISDIIKKQSIDKIQDIGTIQEILTKYEESLQREYDFMTQESTNPLNLNPFDIKDKLDELEKFNENISHLNQNQKNNLILLFQKKIISPSIFNFEKNQLDRLLNIDSNNITQLEPRVQRLFEKNEYQPFQMYLPELIMANITYGISFETMLHLLSKETNGGPGAIRAQPGINQNGPNYTPKIGIPENFPVRAASTTAFGLGQMIDRTWEQYGEAKGYNRMTAHGQIMAMANYINYIKNQRVPASSNFLPNELRGISPEKLAIVFYNTGPYFFTSNSITQETTDRWAKQQATLIRQGYEKMKTKNGNNYKQIYFLAAANYYLNLNLNLNYKLA